MDENIAKRLIISGRVQGVFFRAETQKAARGMGVTGWVRNLADGTVEALAEGEPNQVEALIRWCHQGSPASRVDRVDVEDREFSGRFHGFDVTY
jgi:acylphosphatase